MSLTTICFVSSKITIVDDFTALVLCGPRFNFPLYYNAPGVFFYVVNFLLCSTFMCCRNPDKVHCFGTIFPNLKFVFASVCAARPVPMQSDE